MGLDAITDALLYKFRFCGICCNLFILPNCTSYIIITFWVAEETEVKLKPFEAGKPEITSQNQHEWLTQLLPKLKTEKKIQKWLE